MSPCRAVPAEAKAWVSGRWALRKPFVQCVLNYLCLSDEVTKRAPIQGLGFLSELIQDAFG